VLLINSSSFENRWQRPLLRLPPAHRNDAQADSNRQWFVINFLVSGHAASSSIS
jgi:hypothetical protein